MKTPREFLLERHKSANAKLDVVRTNVLARTLSATHSRGLVSPVALAHRSWQELVWSCRRIWLGLSVAWMIILAVNLATHERSTTSHPTAAETSPQIRALLREQRRMLAELIDTWPNEPVTAPFVPRPRSEWHTRFLIG